MLSRPPQLNGLKAAAAKLKSGAIPGVTPGDSPGDVESLSAAVPVTGHAGSRGCFALPALLFTDVAGLQKEKERKIKALTRISRKYVCFTPTDQQEAKPPRTWNSVASHLPPVTRALGCCSVACTKLIHLSSQNNNCVRSKCGVTSTQLQGRACSGCRGLGKRERRTKKLLARIGIYFLSYMERNLSTWKLK